VSEGKRAGPGFAGLVLGLLRDERPLVRSPSRVSVDMYVLVGVGVGVAVLVMVLFGVVVLAGVPAGAEARHLKYLG